MEPLKKRLRCTSVVEGREALVNEDGDPTGRTRVTSVTASFWDCDIPREIHSDRKFTAHLTTMMPFEFLDIELNGIYEITIERK